MGERTQLAEEICSACRHGQVNPRAWRKTNRLRISCRTCGEMLMLSYMPNYFPASRAFVADKLSDKTDTSVWTAIPVARPTSHTLQQSYVSTALDPSVSPHLCIAEAYLSRLATIKSDLGLPDVDVEIKDLTYEIQVNPQQDRVRGLLSRIATPVTWWFHRQNKIPLPILNNINLSFKAGSSTLILGAPGSGKSTLLRAIAGRGVPTKVAEHVHYNGAASAALAARGLNVKRLVGYAPQEDLHEPLLTVAETLNFAHLNSAAPLPAGASEIAIKERANRVDDVIRLLGLDVCRDTIVGNAQIRGISGGQKKRVTIAEAILSGSRVLALDEITNGLDSSTAFDIMKYLIDWAKATRGTVVAALQAPTPEVFAAFENVIVLSEGMVLYHGPTVGLKDYLFSCGYAQPSYVDIADFAVQIATSPSTALSLYSADVAEMGAPQAKATTPEQMADTWTETHRTEKAASEGAQAGANAFEELSTFSKQQLGAAYARSLWEHNKLLFWRQFKLLSRNKPLVMSKIMQSIVMGLIIGSVFYQVGDDNFVMFISLGLFSSIFLAYSNMAEVPVIFQSKKIVQRHLDTNMYPAWSYVLSVMAMHFPVAAIGDIIFCTLLYWMVGFANDAGRWWFFIFTGFAVDLSISSFFRFYAMVAPSEEIAGVLAGAGTGLQLIYGGFLIIKSNLQDYSLPFYYFTPFSWSVRSMSLNQFRDDMYDEPLYPGPGAPTKGETYAAIFGLDYDFAWKISGPFVLLGYYFLIGILLCGLALKFIKPRVLPGTRRVLRSATATTSEEPTPQKVGGHHSLPFVPAALAFSDIAYSVYNPRTKKTITLLHGISGYAKPGTMTALMGASGAGKTTLLDVLADRKTSGKISGSKLVNGQEIGARDFARISAYCEQEDVHLPTTTVEEALQFSAALRLAKEVTVQQRTDFVDWILEVLELNHAASRVVGSLAPGELKRLTIGVELAANSSILFLDEPTTGLDSRSASAVMRVIKKIADSGRTVIATIHQPSAAIFFDFSHLILLAPGGYQVYAGAVGHKSAAMVQYLQNLPGVQTLPAGINPATWMLEQTKPSKHMAASAGSIESGDQSPNDVALEVTSPTSPVVSEAASALGVPTLAAHYERSSLKVDNDSTVAALSTSVGQKMALHHVTAGFWFQLRKVLTRSARHLWRDPSSQIIRMLVFLFISLFFGLTYFDVGEATTQNGVLSKLGLMFSGPVFAAIATFNVALPGLFNARSVFYRERAAHIYAPEAYSLSIILREQPWYLFYSLLFSAISYFMEGLNKDPKAFFTFVLGLQLLLVYYGAMSNWVSGFFPNPQIAQIIGGVTITIINLFGGVSVPIPDIPRGWKGMYYADGLAHCLRLVSLPQVVCEDGSGPGCAQITVVVNGQQQVTTVYDYAVSRLGMTYERRWEAAGWLLFIGILFQVLTVLTYRFVNHQKR